MTLRRNIAANYAGQIYAGLVGIAVVPLYLRIMDGEAYGLVGFFALLQTWSQLLDLGMSATMSRETARHLGGAMDSRTLRQLLRTLEWLFWPLGILMAVALAVAAPAIATGWLKVQGLRSAEVEAALMLMAAAVALRWVSGLYRGVVSGLERQVWLNGFNALIATARFLLVIPVLLYVGRGPVYFFAFQALVSIAELVVLVVVVYRLVPLPAGLRARWSPRMLRQVLAFSATIAFATVVWVIVTQIDKLVLSTLLPLAEYGYFTAAVMAASAITMLSAAIAQAVLPRLSRLAQEDDQAAFVGLYRQATQWTAAIAGPLTLALASLAEPVLWAWTGERALSLSYAPVLALYAIGNGFMTLAGFPYYLQYAKGDLRLHLRGNILFAAILVPAVLQATTHFGAVGAGGVWALSNAAFFFLWSPVVHRRMLPGLHAQWLVQDVLRILALPLALATAVFWIPVDRFGRAESAMLAVAVAASLLLVTLWMTPLARKQLGTWYRRVVA